MRRIILTLSFLLYWELLASMFPRFLFFTPSTFITQFIVSWVVDRGDDVVVDHVIDGDTLMLAGGQIVQYIGIDAPDVQSHEPDECYSDNAAEWNRMFVEGKIVRLKKDRQWTDQEGVWFRYVYVGSQFVNQELVRRGVARVTTQPSSKQRELLRAQQEAQQESRGVWKYCISYSI